jgi:hypothetical protein
LAAQVAAFGMAALDCLRCSMTERDIPLQILLRMQSNAVALNRMAEKSRRSLEARQRDRGRGQAATIEAGHLDDAEFQTAISKAWQMVAFARAKLEAHRVSKALLTPAVPAAAVRPIPAAGVPVIAEQITPDVPGRRKGAEQNWARELAMLAGLQGLTWH